MNLEPESERESSDSLDTDESSSTLISESETSDNENDPDEVTAHSTTWTFGVDCTIDTYKDGVYSPRLIGISDVSKFKELDYWKLFFPTEKLCDILACTNKNLCERRKHVTERDFYT